MPLQPQDLLAPKGRVEGGSFFPDLSPAAVEGRLQDYIEQGYAAAVELGVDAADTDAAVRHYAYWKVFDNLLLRVNTNPISASKSEAGGSASATYSQAQLDKIAEWAAEEQLGWESYLPVDAGEEAKGPPTTTVFAPNTFVF